MEAGSGAASADLAACVRAAGGGADAAGRRVDALDASIKQKTKRRRTIEREEALLECLCNMKRGELETLAEQVPELAGRATPLARLESLAELAETRPPAREVLWEARLRGEQGLTRAGGRGAAEAGGPGAECVPESAVGGRTLL